MVYDHSDKVMLTDRLITPVPSVHGFPSQFAFTRGTADFYGGKCWPYQNPFQAGSNKSKEWSRGQDYAYFHTLRRQKSIEESIRNHPRSILSYALREQGAVA